MSVPNRASSFVLHDIFIILVSIGTAVLLARTDVFERLVSSARELEFVSSFVAGLFFTSVFTTAPAMVALGEIARINSLLPTAFFGAIGAVIGDYIIFRFMRDRFAEHVLELVSHRHLGKRLGVLLRRRLFRWLSFFVGGLIIASPLPDELGLGLFGFSKMRTSLFVPLSFVFNFIGIVLIGLVAKSL
jgi:hypothetical protein